MKTYTVQDFQRDFPDDATCLAWLERFLWPDGIRCPKCKKVTRHHRIAKRQSFSCDTCGHHTYPMADTIFRKSTTPLRTWFYAIYLMSSTRCGMSAKQLQRMTGVTYKTAWRMWAQIRKLLGDEGGTVSDEVEMDDTYMGGRKRRGTKRGRADVDSHKTPVLGIVQRKGPVIAKITGSTARYSFMPIIKERVLPDTTIYTDDYSTYRNLDRRYRHHRIKHSAKVYVMGRVHTNTIEGFFSLLKRGISGTYHAVSQKYLQRYVDEFAFRYNHRRDETPMFTSMLRRVLDVPAGPPSQGLS